MPKIQNYTDVCVFPYTVTAGVFHGGIEAEVDCVEGRMRGGAKQRDALLSRVKTPHYLPGNALYAGPLWNHFGHILVDSLHRLWAVKAHDHIVFSGVIGLRGVSDQEGLDNWEPPQILFDLLDMMGVTTPVYIARQPVLCKKLDVPEPGSRWKIGPQPWYFEHLQRYQRRITEMVGHLDAPDKMYFSRCHMMAEGGIVGSEFIAQAAENSGVAIVRPEKQALGQQFANLLNGRRILFDEGSSVHLTELLAKPGASFYMLPRRTSDSVFARALRPRSPYAQLTPGSNVQVLPDRNGRPDTTLSISLFKQPEPVLAAITKAGFITSPVDMDEYFVAERDALYKARAHKPEIRQARMQALAELRSGASVALSGAGVGDVVATNHTKAGVA